MKVTRVKRITCGCEEYPFCEHAPNAVNPKPTFVKTTDLGSVVEVSVGDRFRVIEIYKPRKIFNNQRPAELNWSALGTVSSEYARQFAEALRWASVECDIINRGGAQ